MSERPAQPNLNQLLHNAAERLQAVGIKSGLAEAEIILTHLLMTERLQMYLEGSKSIDTDIVESFELIVAKRETRYPLQYILGESYFFGRRFVVNEAVMIPTPETELLCESALQFLRYRELSTPRILDVGCGSGVVCVTMKLESPESSVTALDISGDALTVASKNAELLDAQGIDFLESDIYSALTDSARFDLILSNPPYIADSEYEGLPPEVKADPRVALTSGEQGLDIIRTLIDQAPNYLAPGGRVMFEIGYDQAELIAKMVDADARYKSHVLLKDLNDIDRVVILSPAETYV